MGVRVSPGTCASTRGASMGIEDLTNQAKGFLKSEQAEGISDKLLDSTAGLANKVTGDKFAEHVDTARNAADGAIGNE